MISVQLLMSVTRLPVKVWFHTNRAASDTNFEAALLNLGNRSGGGRREINQKGEKI